MRRSAAAPLPTAGQTYPKNVESLSRPRGEKSGPPTFPARPIRGAAQVRVVLLETFPRLNLETAPPQYGFWLGSLATVNTLGRKVGEHEAQATFPRPPHVYGPARGGLRLPCALSY